MAAIDCLYCCTSGVFEEACTVRHKVIQNRYQVLKTLGTGGMGEVLLVQDKLKKNTKVALKTIRPNIPNAEELLDYFKTEFDSLRKLTHPNVAAVYDFGFNERRDEHFFTAEYVKGTSLLGISSKLAAAQAYGIIVQICRGLEYIHSRGIIHYDVKPQHILVAGRAPKLTAKIIDFGLAAEVQTESGLPIRGTPAYLAPEIVKGEVVDHRADLYSLGATLYHVLCGRAPFEGKSTLAILRQHIEKAPKFPKTVSRKVPSPLREITLKLLSKEPSERYQSANEVIEAINKLAKKKFEVETVETRKSYILSPRFVGRQRELEILKKRLEELRAGKLQKFLILISGEDGTGKSRLLRELKHRVQLSDTPCLVGEAGTAAGLGPFADILRQLVISLGVRSALVGKFAPYLVNFVSEVARGRKIKKLAPLGAREEKTRLLDNLTQFVLSASRGKKFVFLIEDIDTADSLSRDFLEYLARAVSSSGEREGSAGLMLCITCMHEGELLSRILKEKYAEQIGITDLTQANVETLIGSMVPLGKQARPFARKVFSVAGGNPLFVEEVMKNLVEEGSIERRGGGWRVDVQEVVLPETLSSVVSRRLSRLSRQALSVLRAIAAFSRPVPTHLLAEVTGVAEISRALLALREVQLVTRRRGGYELRQSYVGQAVISGMRRKLLERLRDSIGASLEKTYEGKVGEHAEEIAYHYLRGSNNEKAYEFGMRAVEKLAELHANEAVIYCCKRVLSFLDKPETKKRLEVSRKLGETLELVGKYEEAKKVYTSLLRLKGLSSLQQAETRKKIGDIHYQKGQYRQALVACTKALRQLEKAKKPTKTLAETYNLVGGIKFRQADYGAAEAHYIKSMKIRKAIGDTLGVGDSLNNLGLLHTFRGDRAKAADCYKQSLHLYKSAHDEGRIGTLFLNLGILLEREGRYTEAVRHFSKSLAIQERIGDKLRAIISRISLGSGLVLKGDYRLALDRLEEGLKASKEAGIVHARMFCLANLAQAYIRIGDHGKAHRYLKEIFEYYGRGLPDQGEVQAHLGLGTVFLHYGEMEKAEKHLLIAIERSNMVDDVRLGIESILALAEQRFETGYCKKSRNLCKEVLGKIVDIGAQDLQAQAQLTLGKCYAAESEWQQARILFEGSLKTSRKLRLPELVQNASYELARVHRKLGNEKKTRKLYAMAMKSVQAVANKLDEKLKTMYLSAPLRKAIREGAEKTTLALEGAPVLPYERSSRLLAIGRKINSELDLEKLLELIMDTAIELSGAQRGFLMLSDTGRLKFEVSRNAEKKTVEKPEDKISNSVVKRVMNKGEPVLSTNAQEDKRLKGARSIVDLKLVSILCVPFKVKGKVIGCVYLDNPYEEKVFGEEDTRQLEYLADHAAIAIENARLYREAIVDSLTDMYTHRYFDTRLKEEISRARRYKRKVSMLMIDVDRFKLVNDTYGHEVGSEVLKQLARIIRQNTREMIDMMKRLPEKGNGTLVGRYGGDEFEVLLPETDSRGAQAVALRIMEKLRESAFADEEGKKRIRVTVSVGIATFPDDAKDEHSLIMRADEALYNAKRAGRNRVFTFSGEEAKEEDLIVKKEILAGAGIGPNLLTRDGITLLGMVSRIMSAGLDPDKMLDLALGMLIDVTMAGRGFIILVDQQGRLGHRAARNVEDDEIDAPDFSRSIVQQVLKSGQTRLIEDALGDKRLHQFQSVIDLKLRSVLCVPVKEKDAVLGAVYLDNTSLAKQFVEEDGALVEAFAQKIAVPLRMSLEHERQAQKIEQLQGELQTRYKYENIVGASKAMQDVFKVLDKVIPTDLNVHIYGKTGTGKELVAKAIHYNGPRKENPFVSVNCGAIPESLLESELFGHVKGAFTGADRDKKGLFEVADGGTLFLDEIGNMSEAMQIRMLRVLEEKEIRPVGGEEPTKIDVRIVSATNRDLRELVERGEFREDLYYRLKVVEIALPPLRERREDIPLLAEHFLKQSAQKGETKKELEPAALDLLLSCDWPGNVRELENLISTLAIFEGRRITQAHVQANLPTKGGTAFPLATLQRSALLSLEEMERDYVKKVLDIVGGNKSEAARTLGISRMRLRRKLKELTEMS
jgi:Nif-specific regulatory protein